MSMNFAREQSLLRQRLQALGSPAAAQKKQQEHGGSTTFLGADAAAIRAAAADLAAAHPQMGRAQMTAFVRTLWQSRIHELRAVGVELLAARAALLEPADLAFLEGLLEDSEVDGLAHKLAGDVVGVLVSKNKKLWRDLRRFAEASHEVLRRAAVRACRRPLLDDSTAFPRFEELVEPLFAVPDATLQQAIDELLSAAAAVHADAVAGLAARHGRTVRLPKKKASKPVASASRAVVVKAAAKPKPTKKPAKKVAKPAARKR
ncbi:MAG TPA: DNA alkylation repair protein [Planctomycetota bacterium]|nr:DNA alkylation repair protein [Planctomycetota bacterium]